MNVGTTDMHSVKAVVKALGGRIVSEQPGPGCGYTRVLIRTAN